MISTWIYWIVYILLTGAGILAFIRLLIGPSLPDRLVAFDVIALTVVGLMAVLAMASKREYFFDILLIWSIVAFVGTVAFAKYLEKKAKRES